MTATTMWAFVGAIALIQIASVYAIVVVRRTEDRAKARAFVIRAAIGALLVFVIGVGGTVLGLVSSFTAVQGSPPSERAADLADGISSSMMLTAAGLVGLVLPIAAAIVAGLRMRNLASR